MARLSRREAWAKKTGKSKYEYKDSAEGRAVKKIDKYYKEKDALEDRQYDISKDKLQKDFKMIMKEAGYAEEDLLEDYARNIDRLEQDKETDLEDLNYYLETTRGRTEEDLDVALQKESRAYQLNMERTQESLAARNLAFSGLSGVRGKEEGLVTEDYETTVEDYMRSSQRSFQDLDRMETVKNLAIETQYGRDIEDSKTAKDRGVRTIGLTKEKAKTGFDSNLSNLNLGKERINWEADYAKDTSKALVEADFGSQYLREKYE